MYKDRSNKSVDFWAWSIIGIIGLLLILVSIILNLTSNYHWLKTPEEILWISGILLGIIGGIGVFRYKNLDSSQQKTFKERFSSTTIIILVFILGILSPNFTPSVFFQNPKQIKIFTSLAAEELEIFENLIDEFDESHEDIRIKIINRKLNPKSLKGCLYDGRHNLCQDFDLILWDISWRDELLRHNVIQKLEGLGKGDSPTPRDFPDSYMPWDVDESVAEHLHYRNVLYFLPYRLNVELTFANKKMSEIPYELCISEEENKKQEEQSKLEAKSNKNTCKMEFPTTWENLASAAKKIANSKKRPNEPVVAIKVKDNDKALFIVNYLRAFGINIETFNPKEETEKTKFENASKVLRRLKSHAIPLQNKKEWEWTPYPNWQIITGLLLSEKVLFARNWIFTLGILHDAKRDSKFKISSGLSGDGSTIPTNILGGQLLAVPIRAPNHRIANQLIKYLLSKDAQARIASQASWPLVSVGLYARLKPWQRRYQDTVQKALKYSEPTPRYWTREVSDIYESLFDNLIAGKVQVITNENDKSPFLVDLQERLQSIRENVKSDINKNYAQDWQKK